MRQIEQVGQMLARILGLAKGGRGDEALGMFDEAYKPLLGVGSRVVAVLDDGQLVDMLMSGSNPDLRRVAMALELLKAEADLYARAGQAGEAAVRYRRAVALAGCLAARSERLLDRGLAADLLGGRRSWCCRPASAWRWPGCWRPSAGTPTPRTPCSS